MHLKPEAKRTIEQTEKLAIIEGSKIISEFLGRVLKLMSFIKLVLCNESPQENKSSVWKMQILGNLAVKVGCQGNIVLTSTHDNCVPKHFLGKVAKFGGRSLYDFF